MDDLDLLGRLGLAALLGGVLGFERELHQQQAGLRTHMVLALGACLATVTALALSERIGQADPARMIGHVLSGIGFLGAGAIVRNGLAVNGLTTAAGLWTAAGVGIAAGVGYWKAAVVTSAAVVVVTGLLHRAENRLLGGNDFRQIEFAARDATGIEERFGDVLREAGFALKRLDVSRRPAEGRIVLKAVARVRADTDPAGLSRSLSSLPGAESVEIR